MLYKVKCRVMWERRADCSGQGSYEYEQGIRAVSRKHALNKALDRMMQLPCVSDRNDGEWRIEGEAKLLTIYDLLKS